MDNTTNAIIGAQRIFKTSISAVVAVVVAAGRAGVEVIARWDKMDNNKDFLGSCSFVKPVLCILIISLGALDNSSSCSEG